MARQLDGPKYNLSINSNILRASCLTLEINEFGCYEAKIEESEKAGSHRELTQDTSTSIAVLHPPFFCSPLCSVLMQPSFCSVSHGSMHEWVLGESLFVMYVYSVSWYGCQGKGCLYLCIACLLESKSGPIAFLIIIYSAQVTTYPAP